MIGSRDKIITGLDMGSSKIAAVAALIDAAGNIKFIANANLPSKGVSSGAVENLNDALESVSKALSKIKEKIGRRPENIFVNISGAGIKAERSVGMTSLAFRGREVTNSDIKKATESASMVTLPMDREVLHRIVRRFSVDQENFISNPLGLHAAKLTCEIYLVSAPIAMMHNIQKCINDAGYDVKEIVFTGIADGYSILGKDEKDEGTALLDIGNAVTEVCVFSDGVPASLNVIPFGTKNIKSDFRESSFVGEAMASIGSRLKTAQDAGGHIKSIVVMGGAAFIDGFIEYIEERLSYPAKTAVVRDVVGNMSGIDSVRAATAIGLVRYGAEKMNSAKKDFRTPIHRVSSKVADLLNNYF